MIVIIYILLLKDKINYSYHEWIHGYNEILTYILHLAIFYYGSGPAQHPLSRLLKPSTLI